MTKQAKVEIRCSEEEKAAWQAAAGGPRKVSAWLRALANTNADPDHLERIVAAGAEAVERKNRLPLSTTGAILPAMKDAVESLPTNKLGEPKKISAYNCPRAHTHRKGTYCGTCKTLI